MHIKVLHTLYLKLTTACSLRCKHCYITNYKTEHTLLNSLIDESFFNKLKFPNLEAVIFHGGEPTEIGAQKFEKVIANFLKHYPKIQFRITSNLITVPDEVLLLMIKNNFTISTSFDVDVRFKTENLLIKWANNIRLLTTQNITVSVLSTLTNPFIKHFNTQEKLVEYFQFLESMSINTFRIERYVNTDFERDELKPTNKQEAEFAILLFKSYYEYLKKSKSPVLLASVQDIFESLEVGKIGQPFVCKACDFAGHLIFDNDGEHLILCSKLVDHYRVRLEEGLEYFVNKYDIIQTMKNLEIDSNAQKIEESCHQCQYSTHCAKQIETCFYHIVLDGALVDDSNECCYGKIFHDWFRTQKNIYTEIKKALPEPFIYRHFKNVNADLSWYFV